MNGIAEETGVPVGATHYRPQLDSYFKRSSAINTDGANMWAPSLGAWIVTGIWRNWQLSDGSIFNPITQPSEKPAQEPVRGVLHVYRPGVRYTDEPVSEPAPTGAMWTSICGQFWKWENGMVWVWGQAGGKGQWVVASIGLESLHNAALFEPIRCGVQEPVSVSTPTVMLGSVEYIAIGRTIYPRAGICVSDEDGIAAFKPRPIPPDFTFALTDTDPGRGLTTVADPDRRLIWGCR